MYDLTYLFETEDINLSYFGKKRINSLYYRYKSKYRNKGAGAFTSEKRGRKKLSDKQAYNNAELEDKLKQAEKRLKEQEAEIEMLKKLTAFLPNTSMKVNKFAVIDDFISNDSYLNLNRTQLIKLLCSHMNVSISGFYLYKKN